MLIMIDKIIEKCSMELEFTRLQQHFVGFDVCAILNGANGCFKNAYDLLNLGTLKFQQI